MFAEDSALRRVTLRLLVADEARLLAHDALLPGVGVCLPAFGVRFGGRAPTMIVHEGVERWSVAAAILVFMPSGDNRVSRASREVRAAASRVFEMIADPCLQPAWDGNDNLAIAAHGQRVRSVGEVFSMTLTKGSVRENHVVEFVEGRRIAWKPAEPGQAPVGHLWRWDVTPIVDGRSFVVHTYDWTDLKDESRYEHARATTSEGLTASIDRLAALVEVDQAVGDAI